MTWRYDNCKGFTLIEVLVALAILAIALTAIIKASNNSIKQAQYLEQKTIAHWVAKHTVTAIQLDLFKPPLAPDELSGNTQMLGHEWYWVALEEKTANPMIRRLHVSVSRDKDSPALVTLAAFKQVAPS